MKDKMIILIKGFFMGIANIIPEVSGGTLAITMGIYEDLIGAISHFFSNFKKNIKFLIPLFIGAGLAIVIGSKVIGYSLEEFPLPTILFFTGLILGGIPMLYKKIEGNINSKNILIFITTFAFIIGLTFLRSGNEVSFTSMNLFSYLMLFVVGVAAAATMIIPGISGSFMLMVMGYYKPLIDVISQFTKFQNIIQNMMILIPFGLGILVGFVGIAKLIEFLFKKFEVPTYFGIIGFVLASIIGIFTSTTGLAFTIGPLLVGIVLFVVGFMIALKLGD